MGFLDSLGSGLQSGLLAGAAGMSNAVFQEQGQAIARRKEYEQNRQAKVAEIMVQAAHSGQIPDEHLPEIQQALGKMGYELPLEALRATPEARQKLSEYARLTSERSKMEAAGTELANYGQPNSAPGLGMPGSNAGLRGGAPVPIQGAGPGWPKAIGPPVPLPPRPQGMAPDQSANSLGVQTHMPASENERNTIFDSSFETAYRNNPDTATRESLNLYNASPVINPPPQQNRVPFSQAQQDQVGDIESQTSAFGHDPAYPSQMMPSAPRVPVKVRPGETPQLASVQTDGIRPREVSGGTIPPIVGDVPGAPQAAPAASHPVISQAIPSDTSHENLMDWYRRAVVATQRGVPGGKEVLAHVMKLLDPTRVDYLNVPQGNSVYDPRTGQLVFQSQSKDATPPEIIKLMNSRAAMAQANPNDPRLEKLDQVIAEYKGTGVTQNVNVDTKGSDSFAKELYKGQADIFNKGYDVAKTAGQGLPALLEMKSLLDKGIISGNFANMKLQLAKVFSQDKAANTEAYISTAGRQVAALVRQIGGAQISDGDRKYAMAVAGGDITLNEESMRKIIDIGERASNALIEEHNQRAGQIESSQYGKDLPYSLKITAPNWNQPAATATSNAPTATLNVSPKVKQSTPQGQSGVNPAAVDMEQERLRAGEPAPPSDLPAGTTLYKTLPNGNPVWLLPNGQKRQQHR